MGDVSRLDARTQAAFAPAPDFKPMPPVQPGDWLAVHDESGQTFEQWRSSRPNLPRAGRRTIYLVAVGDLEDRVEMDVLVRYTEAFFGLPVAVLPTIGAERTGARSRTFMGRRQLHAGEVMDHLRTVLPDDAYCLLAVTMEDLFPEDDWNFVFGQASLVDRVGVFSFVRYDRDLDGAEATPAPLFYRRALQTVSHEIGHMFGVQHCTAHACNMNGSNSLRESDTQPAHVCPVCLRKLHHATGFDPATRYRTLQAIYEELELVEPAAVASRLAARIEAVDR